MGSRRRRLRIVLAWVASTLSAGSALGVVVHTPETLLLGAMIIIVWSTVVLILPLLIWSALSILDSPGMTERLCRLIQVWRGRPIKRTDPGHAPTPSLRQPRASSAPGAIKATKGTRG
jgi:hypothetical protein